MLAWAQEDPLNERIFWSQIYPKLLPLTLNGTGEDDAIKTSVTVEFVAPK